MTQATDHPDIEGFSLFPFNPKGNHIIRGHSVYRSPTSGFRKRKPVVVLHEMFGLSHECVSLCRRLTEDGFAVYMPVLFGTPLPDNWGEIIYNTIRMCVGREFSLFRLNAGSPVTNWVRALCSEVASNHEGARVGVIGMCLTAHVVFPLTYETSVDAVVASQSAVPFTVPGAACLNTERRRRDLGIGVAERDRIHETADLARVCAMRFENDPISPADRLDAVAATFPAAVIRPVEDTVGRRRSMFKPHSVLTAEYCDDEEADTRRAYNEVVAFLKATT